MHLCIKELDGTVGIMCCNGEACLQVGLVPPLPPCTREGKGGDLHETNGSCGFMLCWALFFLPYTSVLYWDERERATGWVVSYMN